ncbi:unnamed protein product [Meloidogyne enterolobii]|uniref:Uncharacterized protein n=1 Tax=Meloidogyne enterolobii TaxID=390850 RepID=A0ACB1A7J6_MELEN
MRFLHYFQIERFSFFVGIFACIHSIFFCYFVDIFSCFSLFFLYSFHRNFVDSHLPFLYFVFGTFDDIPYFFDNILYYNHFC